MNLHNVTALLALADAASVTEAAAALGVPRTTLRRRLESLEAEVGVPLAHRGAGRPSLTPAGEVIAEQGRALLRSSNAMLNQARSAMARASGVVRLVTPVGMPNHLRLQALTMISQLNVGLRLHVREVPAPLDVLDQRFDVLFYFGRPPSTGGWIGQVLRRVPLRLVASPSYLERAGTPETIEALREHRLLSWVDPCLAPDQLLGREDTNYAIEPWLASSNLTLLRIAASRGAGILWAPELGVPDDPGVAALVPVMDEIVGTQLAFRSLSPRPSRIDPKVREIVGNIQRLLAEVSGISEHSTRSGIPEK